MPEIDIIVDKAGNVTIETRGYIGPKCKDASKFLNKLGKVVEDKPTREYHLQERTQLKQRG